MITGFNTDIEHGGTTYHVQTEDKGLETPLILSLVYVGGAILASKRTPYDDLVVDGFEEKALADRLQRQHKLICAAIRAGRIEDLKRMGEREPPSKSASQKNAESAISVPVEEKSNGAPVAAEVPSRPPSIIDLLTDPSVPIVPEGIEIRKHFTSNIPSAVTLPASPDSGEIEDALPPPIEEGWDELYLTLMDDEGEFRAGQLVTIKIFVGRGKFGRRALSEASITVKVLGTTFRPLILTTKTDLDGLAVVRALLPHFTSGRAAVLIRATDESGNVAELRRIIHQ